MPTVLAAVLAGLAVLVLATPSPARRRVAGLTGRGPRSAPAAQGPGGSPRPRPDPAGRGGLAGRPARSAAGLLAGAGVAAVLGGSVGLLAGTVAAAVVYHWLGRLEPGAVTRRRAQIQAQVPLVADLLHACVAAGTPPSRAVDAVATSVGGPIGELLAGAQARARLGADPVSAWSAVTAEPALRALGRALAAAGERGASPVDSLRQVADDARDSARREAEARARALGARAAAPLGLCFLPAFVLIGVVPIVAGAAVRLS